VKQRIYVLRGGGGLDNFSAAINEIPLSQHLYQKFL
jgi:hypothetical protein